SGGVVLPAAGARGTGWARAPFGGRPSLGRWPPRRRARRSSPGARPPEPPTDRAPGLRRFSVPEATRANGHLRRRLLRGEGATPDHPQAGLAPEKTAAASSSRSVRAARPAWAAAPVRRAWAMGRGPRALPAPERSALRTFSPS